MFNIVEIKNRIKALGVLTEADRKVLLIIDSFLGCGEAYTKANLARKITKYAGCEAWKIAMDYTYTENQ